MMGSTEKLSYAIVSKNSCERFFQRIYNVVTCVGSNFDRQRLAEIANECQRWQMIAKLSSESHVSEFGSDNKEKCNLDHGA